MIKISCEYKMIISGTIPDDRVTRTDEEIQCRLPSLRADIEGMLNTDTDQYTKVQLEEVATSFERVG